MSLKIGLSVPDVLQRNRASKASASAYQNQLLHHSPSQQRWLQQFSRWYCASLVLSPISDHTYTNFFLLAFGSRGFFLLFWYFSLQCLNLGMHSGKFGFLKIKDLPRCLEVCLFLSCDKHAKCQCEGAELITLAFVIWDIKNSKVALLHISVEACIKIY